MAAASVGSRPCCHRGAGCSRAATCAGHNTCWRLCRCGGGGGSCLVRLFVTLELARRAVARASTDVIHIARRQLARNHTRPGELPSRDPLATGVRAATIVKVARARGHLSGDVAEERVAVKLALVVCARAAVEEPGACRLHSRLVAQERAGNKGTLTPSLTLILVEVVIAYFGATYQQNKIPCAPISVGACLHVSELSTTCR